MSCRFSALALVAAASAACFTAETSFSIPIRERSLPCTRQADGPYVYRCTAQGDTYFVTAVRDCSIPEKFTTQATTRQLLIGFSDMRVLQQDTVTFGTENGLRTTVEAKLDADPVNLVSFTFRRERCVEDLIVWKAAGGNSAASMGATVTELAEQLMQGGISAAEPSVEPKRLT